MEREAHPLKNETVVRLRAVPERGRHMIREAPWTPVKRPTVLVRET